MKKIYRLQGIGGSVYVALPKEWLRRFNLDKGSVVEVSIDVDGALKILPIAKSEKVLESSEARYGNEIEIFVDKPAEVYTSLLTAYLRGFDTITLRFSGGAIEREVKGVIESTKDLLLGLETVDIGSNYIVLKVLASEDADIDSLIRNMHKMIRFMYLDAFNSLESGDIELAKAVVLRDRDVNRLYFYITRTIRKRILTQVLEPKVLLKLVDSRMLIKFIEEIGDEAKNAALASIELSPKREKLSKESIDKVKEAVNNIDEIYRDVVMKAHEKSIEIAELRQYMKTCLITRDSLKHLRVKLIESLDLYWFTEFIKSFENIAMNVYDILSLIPFELVSAMIYE
ncbi:phosphate uptake regulator PhoU [Ignisphaera sp. 4213-co]|uniref:Phosphate uptake regulator PhoU n=1 Tax=Ignisphaera cupida TaxID=3050454 RepID=A0ABD4Z4T8_9CREN|nr:phosphate uptake regulator PhoU [Ignisphaera sp. 4213-co]MDK6028134.1 phosphate uptake regulator PhoU [Ignisphaera sp. 4213-co]